MANKKPQEIKIKKPEEKILEENEWKNTKKLVKECNLLAEDINELLINLCQKYTSLNAKIKEAYESAPEKEAHLISSPISPLKIIHALKAHLMKNNLKLQNTYLGDPRKIKDFADQVNDATKWILKYSKIK